ncbi:unnamed protein product [Brachionus calyciflorus]|uniref:Uncharacterized protein n=1 Tax=Brachionus calyciflorus TaxID=104777 RepID=A0A814MUP2_9BILA|nr:unnamed protein product [Brachionus calyciflorus]
MNSPFYFDLKKQRKLAIDSVISNGSEYFSPSGSDKSYDQNSDIEFSDSKEHYLIKLYDLLQKENSKIKKKLDEFEKKQKALLEDLEDSGNKIANLNKKV